MAIEKEEVPKTKGSHSPPVQGKLDQIRSASIKGRNQRHILVDIPQESTLLKNLVGRLFELEHFPVFYPIPDEPFPHSDGDFPLCLTEVCPVTQSNLLKRNFEKKKKEERGRERLEVRSSELRGPLAQNVSQQFKFKTRLQRLNSMEASARANTNFMEQLYLFHKQQGNSAAVVTNGSNFRYQSSIINLKQINEMGGYDNDECLGKRKKTGHTSTKTLVKR
ncbi:hypothetical protein PPACK8108_LOCUS12818, partial [Phakopsora pachyrhizi]